MPTTMRPSSPHNKIYHTSLDSVRKRLWQVAYGDCGRRIDFWPGIDCGSKKDGTYENFCGILLYAVQQYYFHPLHPKKYNYVWKVTFGEGTLPKIARNKPDKNGGQVTIVVRAESFIMGKTLATIKKNDY